MEKSSKREPFFIEQVVCRLKLVNLFVKCLNVTINFLNLINFFIRTTVFRTFKIKLDGGYEMSLLIK